MICKKKGKKYAHVKERQSRERRIHSLADKKTDNKLNALSSPPAIYDYFVGRVANKSKPVQHLLSPEF